MTKLLSQPTSQVRLICSTAGRGESYASFNPYINGTYALTVYVREEVLEGFPLEINIGDVRPRTRNAKKTFCGNGSKAGKLGDPHGVTIDQEGNVIVTDSRNHRIQVRRERV